MDKINHTCPYGDCPGLDSGPKSREHEGRFAKRSPSSSQVVNAGTPSIIHTDSAQNGANVQEAAK